MKTSRRNVVGIASWLWLASVGAALAEGLEVRGRIFDSNGRPLRGAEVEVRTLAGWYETGKRLLEGRPAPPPVAETRTGRGGAFRIEAPGPGMWSLVVRHREHLEVACDLEPLLGPAELPEVRMPRRQERRFRTVDDRGRPVAGADLTRPSRPRGNRLWERFRWRTESGHARSSDDGWATLPTPAGEPVLVEVISGEHYHFESVEPGSADVTLKLQGRRVDARVVDAGGRPAPGLVALLELRLAAGVTGPEGELRAPYFPGQGIPALTFVDQAGLVGFVEVGEEAPAGEEPVVLRLPPTERFHGTVLDAATREAIPGAWLWTISGFRRTDARGAFSLRLPAGFDLIVQVAAAGYVRKGLEVAPGSLPDSGLTVALVPALALAGRVVDGDGRGLEGAEIRALPDRGSPAFRRQTDGLGVLPELAPQELTARSGAGGRFRLEGLVPDGGYLLRARRDGYAPGRLTVPPLAADRGPREVQISLEPGLGAFGVVVDADDRPIPGVLVALLPTFGPIDSISQLKLRTAFDEPVQAETDAGGRFELSDLPPGIFSLRAQAPGFSSLTLPGVEIAPKEGPLDLGTLILERGLKLRGRVVDADGEGLEGARVSGPRDDLFAITDPDGAFHLEGVPREPFMLSVGLEGYRHVDLSGVTVELDRPLEIVLEPAVSVSGQVIGPRGEPATDAKVRLTRRGRRTGWSRSGRGVDSEGRFRFDDQAPGKVILSVESSEGVTEPLTVELDPAEPLELRFELRPGATLEGRLTDADGAGVVEADIVLEPNRPGALEKQRDFSEAPRAKTDGDGRFAFLGLAAGRYRLSAEHPDFEPIAEVIDLQAGVGRSVELVFDRRRDREALRLAGRVVDADGAGVDDAQVTLVAQGRHSGEATTTFGGGAFAIEAPAPGTYTLLVEHPAHAAHRTGPLELGERPAEEILVRLLPGASVGGRVLGLEAAQLARVVVRASSRTHGERSAAVSRDGAYLLENLAPGEWFIWAGLGVGGRVVRDSVDLAPGDVVERDLIFAAGLRWSGLVLKDGSPLAGGEVEARCPGGGSYRTSIRFDGLFVFEDIGAGLCLLILSDRDGFLARRWVEVAGDEEVIEITTARLAGRVLTAGELIPVAGARLALHLPHSRRGSPPVAVDETDFEGRFAFREVDSERWTVRVVADGFVAVDSAVDPATDLGDLRILLRPATLAVLLVRDADGAVSQWVVVVVKDPAGVVVEAQEYRPDLDGRVVLRSLAAGTWKVEVHGRHGARATGELVTPGDPLRLVLGE